MTVPEGLSELLEEFAVTVLREKPKDLVEFAAVYFNNLNMSRKREEEKKVAISVTQSEQASTAEVEMTVEGQTLVFFFVKKSARGEAQLHSCS